jgi:hypothetical protein
MSLGARLQPAAENGITTPMRYFVVTDGGESGPHTPAVLNRMFQKGQVRGEQLCREENSQQTRRLDEVFRHFAPSQEVVMKARKNVAQWNQQAGAASISLGIVFVAIGVFRTLITTNIFSGIAFFIVGIGLIVNGVAQRRRGVAAAAKLAASEPTPPVSPAKTDDRTDPPSTYNY